MKNSKEKKCTVFVDSIQPVECLQKTPFDKLLILIYFRTICFMLKFVIN